MPTPPYFTKCPPFPDQIPVVDLPRISFRALQDDCRNEASNMYEACREFGFFLLDLSGSDDGTTLLNHAGRMFDLTTETFALGQETLGKFAYNPPRDLTGYKTTGKLKTDDGKLDSVELYNINQDDILGNSPPRQNVDSVESRRNECGAFIQHAHAAISVVLGHLDTQLGLVPGTLGTLSPLDAPSDTSVRLLLSQSHPGTEDSPITLGGHTDIGTMTLLFNVVGGLQILPASSENVMKNWRYVRPEPGCAIVNIGDTVVEWTGGLLRSSLHRVVKAPGEQAQVPRRSVAYLIRPRRDATMSRLKGGIIPLLRDGEEEETRSVSDWAAWRARQVMIGELKPQTRGGKSFSVA
ncbi:uncharacterized protein N7459_005494 [Penicillium hispanicum]|uniref:uncharacterized protein n=1 Tax=Penicillium hispanicum TaxID=1080232 RepID=UPI002541A7BE|nr:uncharacterized protein N7459_005494 [Penicillium hispanicum]KAJ5579509.1 hypothetical protein N7459_005494 [Penicillium hispanicum]